MTRTAYFTAQADGTWTAPGRRSLAGGSRSSLVPGTYIPDLNSTGVLPGVTLTAISGNYIVTVPGQVLTNLDIQGQLIIRAANVTAVNCRVRGGVITGNAGLIDCTSALCVNFQAVDCTLIPSNPSYWWNAIIGHDYSLLRCQWMFTVDGYRGYRTDFPERTLNISVVACWGGAYSFFSPDPNHANDNRVHSDGGQIESGLARNHSIGSTASWLTALTLISDASVVSRFNAFWGWYAGGDLFPTRYPGFVASTSDPLTNPPNAQLTALRDATTSILQVTPNVGVPVTGIWFEGNHCYGAGVGVSLAGGGGSGKRNPGVFKDNVFDGQQRQSGLQGTSSAWTFSIKSVEYGDRDISELLGVYTGNTNAASGGAARLGRVTA